MREKDCVLKTNALTKNYKGRKVVNAVSMTVNRGDIYGFIGKNGAGKTTLMKMVCGLIAPSEGEFSLFGSGNLEKGRKKVGCVIEQPALYPTMTARENIDYFSKMQGCYQTTNPEEILKTVGLSNVGKKKTKQFSLGMKQRMSIGIALIGNPEFLILDEPINGLDPAGILEVRELLLKLNRERNITILISSHILGELGKIATKYGIINQGELVEEFTAEELEARSKRCIRIVADDVRKASHILEEKFKLNQLEMISDREMNVYANLDDTAQMNRELVMGGIMVSHIGVEGQNMENYFVQRMGGL